MVSKLLWLTMAAACSDSKEHSAPPAYMPCNTLEQAHAGLLNQQPLNVYLHLPYCLQCCAYCHYKTTTLRNTQLSEIDRYVGSL
jgi:coproporphyrinogen III oxidase-like Fe-S oxidoreductase